MSINTLIDKMINNGTEKRDYRKWTLTELDDAIMYQCTYGCDLQKLDSLLSARKAKGQSKNSSK